MKFKGTKGEWKFGGRSKHYQYINGLGWDGLARVPVKIQGESEDHEEGVANAKLIAAAPELLEAAIKLKELSVKLWGEDESMHPRIMDRFEKAIEKALKPKTQTLTNQ